MAKSSIFFCLSLILLIGGMGFSTLGCSSSRKSGSLVQGQTSYLDRADREFALQRNPSRLKLMDLEQLDKFVQDELAAAQEEGTDSDAILAQAFFVLLARPNSDGSFEKVSIALKREMIDSKMYEPLLAEIAETCLRPLEASDQTSAGVSQALADWICLENLMAELSPQRSKPFAQSILRRIASASVSISRPLQNARANLGLRSSGSPSAIAQRMLQP